MKMRTTLASCTLRRLVLGAGLVLGIGLAGRAMLAQTAAMPEFRIVAPVSNTVLTTLMGNVHPLAAPRYDHGLAPAEMGSGRMMLLLRRSDAQTRALARYLDQVKDPASAEYRQWLTPAAYGAAYGISDADLAIVTGWLKGQGLAIERVPEARNLVVFSGTVGAIQKAFHTSIHRYVVGGEQHYANASDPQIPAALAPVVAGISPMNNFRASPQHQAGAGGVWDPETKRIKPQLTLQGGTQANPVDYLYVDPADAATIYNTPNAVLNRNYASSRSLDGTGVTIGILGYSDLYVDDVEDYRYVFLDQSTGSYSLNLIVDGEDPGASSGGDAVEALLDTEVAGGLATGAAINYYNAASTNLADGLQLAALRAIDDNQVSILSVSYGNCEANLGASGNLMFAELWQQAAAQGITVVVSSGDSGSAACDDDNTETAATHGLAVSGLASTPYNIAVGGTDFDTLPSNFAKYAETSGGAPPYYGTALGYLPESTWNNSVESDGSLLQNLPYRSSATGDTNIVAGGGGVSSAAACSTALDADGNCPGTFAGYAKPAYQNAITTGDGVRDLPDVALFAANGKYQATWVLCSDSNTDGNLGGYLNCQTDNGVLGSDSNFDGVGGTSASAPALAGILAIVSQSLGGVRLGQANNVLYNLAHGSHASSIFHTVGGNNAVPCEAGSQDCLSNSFLNGYNAGSPYSEAAGLGSLDVTALVNAWPTAVFTSTLTSLEVGTSIEALGTGSISVTHGTPLYFSVAVTPVGAVGSVSVTNTSGVANNAASNSDLITLSSNGTGSFTASNLPGGSYTISAYYAGDATHAASTSSPINVTVAQEPSTTALSLQIYDPSTGEPVNATTLSYGFYGFVNAQPYGNNSTRNSQGAIVPDGPPSGMVGFGDPSPCCFISSPVDSRGLAQVPIRTLAPGSYSIQADYSGDASLGPSASSIQPLTITKAPTTLAVQLSSTTEDATGTVIATITLMTDSVGSFPTGEINLVANGISFGGGIQNLYINGLDAVRQSIPVPGNALAPGQNTLAISFDGDANYLSTATTATITVVATPSFTLSGPGTAVSIAAPGQPGTATITLAPANGFTGTVALSCSITAISGGVAPSCSVPSSVVVTGTGAVTAQLSVRTTAGSAENRLPLGQWFGRGAGVALGWLVLWSAPGLRRRGWISMVGLLVLGVGASGCGGGAGSSGSSPGSPGTLVGTYTVNVTGTSGSLSASTQVTVTVE